MVEGAGLKNLSGEVGIAGSNPAIRTMTLLRIDYKQVQTLGATINNEYEKQDLEDATEEEIKKALSLWRSVKEIQEFEGVEEDIKIESVRLV